MRKAIIVNGAPGCGKTTTAIFASKLLAERKVKHALFDLDHLRWLIPAPEGDPFSEGLGVENLEAIWPNYVKRGATCAIIASVIEAQRDVDAISKALGGLACRVVNISVTDDVFYRRLASGGRDQDDRSLRLHVSRRRALTSVFDSADYPFTWLDASDLTVAQAAESVAQMFFED